MSTNTAVDVTNSDTNTDTKRSVGRPVDPSAKIHKAREIYESLPDDQRKVKIVSQLFVEKLDVTPGTAQVYFYNVRKTIKDETTS